MGGLLAGCAEETVAGWTRHFAIERLHWAEKFGARWPRTVPSILGWSSPFNRSLCKVLPNFGRYEFPQGLWRDRQFATPWRIKCLVDGCLFYKAPETEGIVRVATGCLHVFLA